MIKMIIEPFSQRYMQAAGWRTAEDNQLSGENTAVLLQ